MKKALLKKRYGIPAAFLIVLLLSGTAVAWYSYTTVSSKTKVVEPLSTANEQEFSNTMYPGDENTWSFDIQNSADVQYDIEFLITDGANETGISVSTFTVGNKNLLSELQGTDGVVRAGDKAIVKLNRKTTNTVTLEISAEEDAPAPQLVSLEIEISRG